VVLLATVAAEIGGVEPLQILATRQVLLAFEHHRADAGRFQRGVGGRRAGEKLVQLEGEERVGRVASSEHPILFGQRGGEQEFLQGGEAAIAIHAGCGGERLRGFFHRQRLGAHRLAVAKIQAERGLDPDGERMIAQLGIRKALEAAGGDRRRQFALDAISRPRGIGGALQRLGDDVAGLDGGIEQLGCDLGNHPVLFFLRALARHGRRGADALQALGAQALPDPAHQQCDVGALAAAVGVQLVQYQKAQVRAVVDHLAVERILAGEQQLQHHEIGQQDVGRVGADLLAHLLALLAGVAREGHRRIGVRQELLQFLELAVGERIHRIDHDGARARRRVRGLGAQNGVDDGDKKTERLARAGACRYHVAAGLARERKGLGLVAMQPHGLTTGLKDTLDFGMEFTRRDVLSNRLARLEARVDLEQRLRPVAAGIKGPIDLAADVVGADVGE